MTGPLLHPGNVRVDRQDTLTEREVADRGGRVWTDARQLGEIVRPAVDRDPLYRAVQVEAAPVVAQPLPLADHVRRRRGSERLDGWPALEPGHKAGDHALHLRLLQHHLGDEDRVGIAGPTPGQVASVLREPGEQGCLHGAGL